MKIAFGEASLWQSFKEGNENSFHSIYIENFDHLYEYGMRLTNNKELVEDAIQDLFVKLWNNKNNLSEVAAIRPYLLVSLRSIIFNQFQRTKRIILTDQSESLPFELVFSREAEIISLENVNEEQEKLKEALNQLTARQKEVIYLRYFEDLSYDQIAEIMSLSVKVTYKLSGRGMQTLRSILNNSSFILFLTFFLASKSIDQDFF